MTKAPVLPHWRGSGRWGAEARRHPLTSACMPTLSTCFCRDISRVCPWPVGDQPGGTGRKQEGPSWLAGQSFLSEVRRLQAWPEAICHTCAPARLKSHTSNTPAYQLTRVASRCGGCSVATPVSLFLFFIYLFLLVCVFSIHVCM